MDDDQSTGSPVTTVVRDFAYSVLHPLHCGPAPEEEEEEEEQPPPSEPGSSGGRLSDPARLGGWPTRSSWGGDGGREHTATSSSSVFAHAHASAPAPPILVQDGPPYTEDGDLHSPIVSWRRKRFKSTTGSGARASGHGQARARAGGRLPEDGGSGGGGRDDVVSDGRMMSQHYDGSGGERYYFAGTREDGSKTYYVSEADGPADGPGGEYVTYPPDQARRRSVLAPFNPRGGGATGQRDSHFAVTLPNRSYVDQSADGGGGGDGGGGDGEDDDEEDGQYDSNEASDTASSPGGGGRGGRGDGEDGGPVDEDDARYSRSYQFSITSPDEEVHGKAVALFDFARENENELPLVEGQVIWVSYRHGQGWLVAEDPRTHESGLVPEEYVRLLRDIRGGWGSLTGEERGEEGRREGGEERRGGS